MIPDVCVIFWKLSFSLIYPLVNKLMLSNSIFQFSIEFTFGPEFSSNWLKCFRHQRKYGICSCNSTSCQLASETSSVSETSLESNSSTQELTITKSSVCPMSKGIPSPQLFRHLLLLMLMCCSMVAGKSFPIELQRTY